MNQASSSLIALSLSRETSVQWIKFLGLARRWKEDSRTPPILFIEAKTSVP